MGIGGEVMASLQVVPESRYDLQEQRIAELEAENKALREALMDALECIEGAAEGHGVDFYAYAKEIKAALPEEGKW